MKLYKRLGMIALLVCLAGTIFAQVYAPNDLDDILDEIKSNGPNKEAYLDELLTLWEGSTLNGQKKHIVDEIGSHILDRLRGEYTADYTNPHELIRGFANAQVFAGHSATQRGYGDYKEFAFTIGAMAGFRLPGGILHPIKDTLKAADALVDEHDIRAGANLQAVTAQIGLNTSSFLLDGLYLGLRYTYVNIIDFEELRFTSYTAGLVAHYHIIKGMDAGNGWHYGWRWRGLTFGTGFLFSNTTLTGSVELDDFDSYGFTASKPKLNLDINATTYTVPLEIYTSALMLWFINVHLGFGVDLAFGKNRSNLSLDTTVSYEDPGNNDAGDVGDIHASGGGTMKPSIFNPKLLGGIGFILGPVILDIPINYYPFGKGNGLSIGITLGITL